MVYIQSSLHFYFYIYLLQCLNVEILDKVNNFRVPLSNKYFLVPFLLARVCLLSPFPWFWWTIIQLSLSTYQPSLSLEASLAKSPTSPSSIIVSLFLFLNHALYILLSLTEYVAQNKYSFFISSQSRPS